MNSLWDIRIFLGLVPKESPYTSQNVIVLSYSSQNETDKAN
jgi:hypothetical protein